MKLDKKTLKKLFKKAGEFLKEDQKLQDAVDKFSKAIAPSSYSLMVGSNQYIAYREALDDLFNIGLDLDYYFFEALDMKECICTTKEGKKYNAKNLDEYIDFVLDYNRDIM
jgi:hypothetical protein